MGKEEEKKQELVFVEMGRKENELVALFMDAKNPALSSLQKAWGANASPTSRNLLPYTEKMLKTRINQFKEIGHTDTANMKAFNHALEVLIEKKKGLVQNHTASMAPPITAM